MERSIAGGEKIKYVVVSQAEFDSVEEAQEYALNLYIDYRTTSALHAVGIERIPGSSVESWYPQPQQQNKQPHKKSHTN
jgi:hypothetical protein